jgi:hypothetical protein
MGGKTHWWQNALVAKHIGGKTHWWQNAVVAKSSGGKKQWWQNAWVAPLLRFFLANQQKQIANTSGHKFPLYSKFNN